jgi:hypothetical protein
LAQAIQVLGGVVLEDEPGFVGMYPPPSERAIELKLVRIKAGPLYRYRSREGEIGPIPIDFSGNDVDRIKDALSDSG